MSVEVDAPGDRAAYENAVKLQGLLRSQMVKFAVESEGIRLHEDGRPIVHEPQRQQ